MDEQREINQEDSWTVISAHFEEKGLVGQQLDSFNEFLTNTIQELIDDSPPIELYPQAQHMPGEELDEEVRIIMVQFFFTHNYGEPQKILLFFNYYIYITSRFMVILLVFILR